MNNSKLKICTANSKFHLIEQKNFSTYIENYAVSFFFLRWSLSFSVDMNGIDLDVSILSGEWRKTYVRLQRERERERAMDRHKAFICLSTYCVSKTKYCKHNERGLLHNSIFSLVWGIERINNVCFGEGKENQKQTVLAYWVLLASC